MDKIAWMDGILWYFMVMFHNISRKKYISVRSGDLAPRQPQHRRIT